MQKFSLLLDRYSKYLLAAFLIIVPLYPKFPFLRIPGSYVSIRFEDFLILLLGIYVLVKVTENLKDFLSNKFTVSISVFLFVGLSSLISGIILLDTVSPSTGTLHFLRRIEYFIPFFAGYYVVKGAEKKFVLIEFFIKCIMIVVFVAFLYGLGQRYLNWPVIITQNEEYSKGVALRWIPGSHINSTFAGHYDLATYLVLTLPILITFFFCLRDKMDKMVLGLVVAGGLWLLSNTVSRISVASYLVAISISLVILKKYKEMLIAIFLSFVIFASSSSLLGRYLNLKNIFTFNIGSVYAQEEVMGIRFGESPTPTPIPVTEDRSTSIRLNVEWPRALRALRKNPLVGTGYSSITLATDNDYLRLLGEVGILGFVAFMIIIFQIIVALLKAIPVLKHTSEMEFSFLAGVTGAFGGMLINAVFIDVFEASKVALMFWFLMGVVANLINDKRNEQIN